MGNDSFDNFLLNQFAGVDILVVEAVSQAAGRAMAAFFKGMLDAGLDRTTALKIMVTVIKTVLAEFRPESKP